MVVMQRRFACPIGQHTFESSHSSCSVTIAQRAENMLVCDSRHAGGSRGGATVVSGSYNGLLVGAKYLWDPKNSNAVLDAACSSRPRGKTTVEVI